MIPAKAFMYGRNMNLLKTSSSMEETVVVIWNTIASTHLWRSSSSCCWIWLLWWRRKHSLASSDQDKMEHKRTEPIREEIPSTDDLLITMMDMTMMIVMIVMVKRSTWSAPHSWAVFFGLRCHITLQQWGNIMIMMVLMLHIWRLLLVHTSPLQFWQSLKICRVKILIKYWMKYCLVIICLRMDILDIFHMMALERLQGSFQYNIKFPNNGVESTSVKDRLYFCKTNWQNFLH